MTLDELEALLKEARNAPCVDGRTEVRVLKYSIQAVRVALPVFGLDGQIQDMPMEEPFAITILPII